MRRVLNDAVNARRRSRFPISYAVDRVPATIEVDGSPEPFTAYVSERRAVGVWTGGDHAVIVCCPAGLLRHLRLGHVTTAELSRRLARQAKQSARFTRRLTAAPSAATGNQTNSVLT